MRREGGEGRRSEKGKGGRVRRDKLGAGLGWREGKGERER